MATDKLVDFDHVTDYISREAALNCNFRLEIYGRMRGKQIVEEAVQAYSDYIKKIPAADVRPVVRARWKAHGDCGVTECPVCRWSIEECINYNFCPYCGADMRKVDADGKS